MKPAIAVPHDLNDVERVANQLVDPVVVELGRVGPRAGSIAPLVRGHDEVARRREGWIWLSQKCRDTQNPCSISTSGAVSGPETEASKTSPGAVLILRVSIMGAFEVAGMSGGGAVFIRLLPAHQGLFLVQL